MSIKKKIILSISITIAVLGIIAGILVIVKNRNTDKKTVDVFPVSEIGYDSTMFGSNSTISGEVAINMEQKVYVSASQQVAEVYVKEGDTVKAGDVLMEYDTTAQNLQLEIERTEVELARVSVITAENELEKLQNTTPVEPTTEAPTTEEPTTEAPTTEEPGTPTDGQPDSTGEPTTEAPTTEAPTTEPPIDIPEEQTYTKEELEKAIAEKQNELRQLRTDYQLRQIALEIMEYQNSNGEVLCNFDGVVKSVNDVETAAANNEPLIVVSGDTGYTVNSSIGELSLMSVKAGDTVNLYCYETGMSYEGIITEISDLPTDGRYNYSTKSESFYPIKIAINDGDDLRAGMYMDVTMNASADENSGSIYISLAYVMRENSRYYVMKEVDGKLEKTYVDTGKIMWGDTIEIKSGISFEDYIAFPYASDAKEGVKTVQKSAYESAY